MEAVDYEGGKSGGRLKWGAAAACLCLVIVGAAMAHRAGILAPDGGDGGLTVSEDGVTIAPMEVDLAANTTANMIGFFIYQGRCYVQYERIYDDVDIIGERLGTAAGLIDEWTPKEGYVELAGSVGGDFYAVKGYDPAFMLCMKETTGEITTYICNNGITLKYGSELYEDRLHLSGNIESVEYESRASWYYGRGERYRMDEVGGAVLDFIAGLDGAEFIPYDSVPLDKGKTYIAETELYHLHFRMRDGMTVHLRLHENGYVRFDGVLPLCAQVPEEAFNALLSLLDGRAGSTAVEVEPVGTTPEGCRNDPELGRYVPAYAPEDVAFAHASIYYELGRETAG